MEESQEKEKKGYNEIKSKKITNNWYENEKKKENTLWSHNNKGKEKIEENIKKVEKPKKQKRNQILFSESDDDNK